MANFLGKGLDESMEKFREKCRQEKAELATVQDALGKEFPQKAELALARENNSAVIRECNECRRMPATSHSGRQKYYKQRILRLIVTV